MNKDTSKPLLSICIPTYNRAEYLKMTLESIVNQDAFLSSNAVEIVVSDNNSDDDTELVVRNLQEKYPFRIKYNKNKKNILDANFTAVLNRASGKFRKLHNDTLPFLQGALSEMVEIVNKNSYERPVLFFLNSTQPKHFCKEYCDATLCSNVDEFLKSASYYVTWIGAFGIWEDDMAFWNKYQCYSSTHLIQTKVLFSIIEEKNKKSVIINKIIFYSVAPKKKGGYSITKVFCNNYLGICTEYLDSGSLSLCTFEEEKKRLMLYHLIPCCFNFFTKYNFITHDFFEHTYPYYRKNLYYYIHVPVFILYYNLKLFIRFIYVHIFGETAWFTLKKIFSREKQ